MHKLPIPVLFGIPGNKDILDADTVAVFFVDARFIGDNHPRFDYRLLHSSRKTPPYVLRTLMDIQHVTDTVAGSAFVVNTLTLLP